MLEQCDIDFNNYYGKYSKECEKIEEYIQNLEAVECLQCKNGNDLVYNEFGEIYCVNCIYKYEYDKMED